MVTATLPQCTSKATKKWRYRWAIQFHLFWEGAKLVRMKVQVLNFHVDEKWFMSLVYRMHIKVAPKFGCSPVHNRIHHRNSVEKVLTICAIGIVPFNDDIRNGGTAEKICITRCGGLVKASKDSYS